MKVGAGVSRIIFTTRFREETKRILKVRVKSTGIDYHRGEIKERVKIGSSFVSKLGDTGSMILTSL